MGRREISQAEHRKELLVLVSDGRDRRPRDLMQHLKTATPFEYTILAEPIEDTPQQAKRQLGAKSNGDANTIRDGPAALSRLRLRLAAEPRGCRRHQADAGANPSLRRRQPAEGISRGRLRDVLLGLARHEPRQSQGASVVLAFEADRHQAPQALAGSDQRPRRSRAGRRQPRRRSSRRPAPGSQSSARRRRSAAPPIRFRNVGISSQARRGTCRCRSAKSSRRSSQGNGRGPRGPGSGGAGGATGGWRGILESMGEPNGFHEPTKMAVGLYVRQFGADCDPEPFYEVYDG